MVSYERFRDRLFLGCLCALLLGVVPAHGFADEALEQAKVGARKLSAKDVTAVLIGNTLGGKSESGDQWFEYYTEDGRVLGIASSSPYKGEWSFDHDFFCLKFPDGDDCYVVMYNDQKKMMYMLHKDGSLYGSTAGSIVAGNPQALE